MNLRQYFQNLSLLYLFNFSIKPIWVFIIERKFQLILGQNDYGRYFYFLSITYILSIFLDLGLHNFSSKTIAENHNTASFSLREILKSKVILIGLYLISVWATIYIMNISSGDMPVFLGIAFAQMLFSVYQFLRTIVQGIQKHQWDSFLSSLDRLVLIIIGALLLYGFNDSINLSWYIYLYIIAYLASIIIISWLLSVSNVNTSKTSTTISGLKSIFLAAYPLLLIQLMMTLYTRLDSIMLKYLYEDGYKACADLAYSFRIVDSSYNALYLISVFLLPTVSYQYTQKNFPYIKRVVNSSMAIATVMSVGFVGVCLLFSNQIYKELYHTDSNYLKEIFTTQLWSVLGVGWMYVYGSYLTAIGAYWSLIAIVTLGTILSIGLNFALIPSIGAVGAARSASIVQVLVGVLHVIVGVYYLYFKKEKI